MWNPDLKIYIRPPAKVFIRSFHTNHFKDYLLIIKDWLNTLTNTGSFGRSRTFTRGLLIMNFFSNVSFIEEDFLKEVEYSAPLRLH